jgi:hypothetical protein
MNASSDSPVTKLQNLIGVRWANLEAAQDRTVDKLDQLREALTARSSDDSGDVSFDSGDASIVAFGSLARGEVTEGSDVDWTLLVDGAAVPNHFDLAAEIGRTIGSVIAKDPGPEGNFGTMVFSHDLVHYIGGDDDSNKNTTRRCLMLLESTVIGGRHDAHERVMRAILQRYVLEDHTFAQGKTKYHVPRFLLNDFARYWRTMAVDFAYKQRKRRGQGAVLRNLKLRFSRKLLYAAALVTCFSCELKLVPACGQGGCQQDDEKMCVACLLDFLRLTPLEMVASALLHFVEGESDSAQRAAHAAEKIFGSYDYFVGVLADAQRRAALERVLPEKFDSDPQVTEVRKRSRKFRDGLLELFFDVDDKMKALTRYYGVF